MSTTFVVLKNRPNGHLVVKATGNGTISVADAAVNANDAIQGLNITRIAWVGKWDVYRGANVVWRANTGTFGTHDFQGLFGCTLNEFPTANVTANSADVTATIVIECNKGTFANGTYGGQ